MASLSISRAWEEGASFVGREFRLLFPIAFLFLALPPVLFNLFVAPAPGADMQQWGAQLQRNGIGGYVLLNLVTTLIEIVLSTLGSLAITYLALRPGTSVGESFSVASRRLLPALGAILLIAIVASVVALIFLLIFGASMMGVVMSSAGSGGGGGAGAAAGLIGGVLLFFILFGLAALAVGAKLAPMTAVAVAERKGPIGIIGRSWALTDGHFWKLVGTLLLISIVYAVGAGAVFAMLWGLVWATVGNPMFNATAAFVLSLLSAVITAVVSSFLLSFMARIYAQLSGHAGEMGEVFR